MTITTRAGKGSALSFAELDGNFTDLDTRTGAGWKDLIAPLTGSGIPAANMPTMRAFGPTNTPQREEWAFAVGNYLFCHAFHVGHDIKVGGLALVHCHWSTNGTNVQPVKWEFCIQRALGHNQANFPAPTVYTKQQAAQGSAWRHMVAEVDIGDALTLAEPDELILVTLRRLTNGATENTDWVFGLTVDFHYEADRDTTPGRAPDFYA
jgi:hypothetical protein